MTGYTLTRSRRRTVAIHLLDGQVEVRAPLRLPKRDIDQFVASKELWIRKRLANWQELSARRAAFTLNYGAAVMFRGAVYPLAEKAGTRAGFDGQAFFLPPGLTPEQLKSIIPQIYRSLAKRFLNERVAHFSGRLSLTPAAVRINGAKTRWGSCSIGQSLNFSWRLVLAEDDVIDYVVVHELAHLTEMNHSPRFWAIVEGVFPDHRERRKRLGALQRRLNAEGWE